MISIGPWFSRILCLRHGLALLAMAALLATGCASKPTDEAALSAGVRENGVLLLTRNDNNRSAEVRVGERIEVRLPENPATGFTWAIDETDRERLALEGTDYTPPEVGMIGARGQRTFTLIARQPGDVVLKIKYWRLWEGDSSIAERFTVTLRIRAAG